MTSHAARQPATPCQIETVRLWFNVFIPEAIDGAKPVPGGPYRGKTMLTTPGPVNAWFLTDGREFSDVPEAPSRMHSEIELDLVNFKVVREQHRCDPTIQVHPETGAEECCETANTDNMAFDDLKLLPKMQTMTMRLKGSSKNACLKLGPVKVSPNVDYEGVISLRLHDSGRELVVGFEGMIETYPAFEMYVTLNGEAATPVFRMPVEPGATPLALVGPPQRPVHESITVSCRTAG